MFYDINEQSMEDKRLKVVGLWGLTPLSRIFQLYRGG